MMNFFKIKISTDRLLSLVAFVISICTLYVFFYQTSLMKKQQYASVLPYLEISNTHIDGDYSFILKNNGIGPSFIDEINIHYRDSIYRGFDVNDFFEQVIVKHDTILKSNSISHATIRKGMLISEKEIKYMLRLRGDAKDFNLKQKRLRYWLNSQMKVEIIYSSVYGEQWKILTSETNMPIKIE